MDLSPVTLTGTWLTLEPIEERHAPDLFVAMQDEEVCRYLAWPPPTKLEETLTLIRQARELMAQRQSIVFAQVWNATGRAIGCASPGTAPTAARRTTCHDSSASGARNS